MASLLFKIFRPEPGTGREGRLSRPVSSHIRSWENANRKMGWGHHEGRVPQASYLSPDPVSIFPVDQLDHILHGTALFQFSADEVLLFKRPMRKVA
jgi:hypothetical protein